MNNGDNQEYQRRSRQGRREGLFYLACIAAGLALGALLLGLR